MADASDPTTFAEALASIGVGGGRIPIRPVIRRPAGTVLAVGRIEPNGAVDYAGAVVAPDRSVRWFGSIPTDVGAPSRAPLPPDTARLVALVHQAAHNYVERLAEIDELVNSLPADGTRPSPATLGRLQRATARVREQIARLTVLASELAGPLAEAFPQLADVYPELRTTVDELPDLASGFHATLQELLLLRVSDESNRLAETANRLAATSNRLASAATVSNVRMLGLAYLALMIALVSLVIVIPNTGATILGMPSAGWVPGGWVVVILIVLTVVPLAAVFSRPWVRRVFRGLPSYEAPVTEGMAGVPELSPDGRPIGPAAPGPDPSGPRFPSEAIDHRRSERGSP